jgi:solute carrier family 25 protein 42
MPCFKSKQIRTVYEREPTTIEKMLIGGGAGLVAQTLTYPLEVIRRRMQTHGLVCGQSANEILNIGKASDVQALERNALPARAPLSKTLKLSEVSMIQIMKDLYREQGARGFFKGVTMNWVKGPIAFSISFTSYDIIKNWIESSVAADSRRTRS